jgi:hypothetical protein
MCHCANSLVVITWFAFRLFAGAFTWLKKKKSDPELDSTRAGHIPHKPLMGKNIR